MAMQEWCFAPDKWMDWRMDSSYHYPFSNWSLYKLLKQLHR